MLRGWLNQIVAWWRRKPAAPEVPIALGPGRLERVVLSDGVARTLFDEYADHRRSPRGEEEIGWVLLGMRQQEHAIAVAALPAGTQREAGVAHVIFNRDAQELACRILRQHDKRLGIIGIVHTHPGHLQHPSEGDLQGDRFWVGQLRGEGVFGIGTADAHATAPTSREHQQCNGNLCFSWYALGQGDAQYRPLAVQVMVGPDLARPLHAVWDLLESYAQPLNRLCRQLARVNMNVMDEGVQKSLCVKIPLAEPRQQLRLLLTEAEARYYWEKEGELSAVDPNEPCLEAAVYRILAELACEPQTLVESSSPH